MLLVKIAVGGAIGTLARYGLSGAIWVRVIRYRRHGAEPPSPR